MKPALTAEEWLIVVDVKLSDSLSDVVDDCLGVTDIDTSLRAAAAIALNDCRFGFTREDVETLRWALNEVNSTLPEGATYAGSLGLLDLASRIEALLPPEDLG